MNLDSIVPWGRTYGEYQKIFDLKSSDLHKSILGCGDGPASFNAQMTQLGGNVVSVDPIYQFTVDEIRSRINEVYSQVISQVEKNIEQYYWQDIKDVATLGKVRMDAMEEFLLDYDKGLAANRYIFASLPKLPFVNQQFDLALCSHFLFLYSDHFSLDQHIDGIEELCRVAAEVRIYPLLSLDGKHSPYLSKVRTYLSNQGLESRLESVDYRFQKDATQMLVITKVS